MKPVRVTIVGAGKRVVETALPALLAAETDFEVRAIFARSEREMVCGPTRRFAVSGIDGLTAADVAETDLFYVAVGKGAVSTVLRTLTKFDVSQKALLLDTPVLLWKQLHSLKVLERFGSASVAEDCVALPWYEAIANFRRSRGLPPPSRIRFDRSAYKYHALAMAKSLLEDPDVVAGSVVRHPDGRSTRTLRFARGGTVRMDEPRDYARGVIHLEWTGVVITDGGSAVTTADFSDPRSERIDLVPWIEAGACVGIRAGDGAVRLDAAEQSLQHVRNPALSITSRMEDWKRIGFLRLLRRLRSGDPGYPILAGLDDSLVDTQLERLRRYRRNPFTTIGTASGRRMLTMLARVFGHG